MNAYRAIKSDFISETDMPVVHRSREEAIADALNDPHTTIMHEHVAEPMVRLAASELIRMDDEGLGTDILETGKPYDVLENISRRLIEHGACRHTAAKIFRELERYVTANGADFSRKFNAKPLYAHIVVSDVKPDVPEKCNFVSVTQINGDRILADDASQVVMQHTIFGTRMSATRQMSMEETLQSGRHKQVWIIHGTVDSDDANSFDTADNGLAALVEAVGMDAAQAAGDIRKAIEEGSLPVETAKLIDTIAEMNRVVEESRTPGAQENTQARIDGLKNTIVQLTDSLSRHDAAIPKALVKAVVASFDKAPIDNASAALTRDAPVSKPEASAPVADNDNSMKAELSILSSAPDSKPVETASAIPSQDAPVTAMANLSSAAQLEATPVDIKSEQPVLAKPVEATPVSAVIDAKPSTPAANTAADVAHIQPQAKAIDAEAVTRDAPALLQTVAAVAATIAEVKTQSPAVVTTAVAETLKNIEAPVTSAAFTAPVTPTQSSYTASSYVAPAYVAPVASVGVAPVSMPDFVAPVSSATPVQTAYTPPQNFSTPQQAPVQQQVAAPVKAETPQVVENRITTVTQPQQAQPVVVPVIQQAPVAPPPVVTVQPVNIDVKPSVPADALVVTQVTTPSAPATSQTGAYTPPANDAGAGFKTGEAFKSPDFKKPEAKNDIDAPAPVSGGDKTFKAVEEIKNTPRNVEDKKIDRTADHRKHVVAENPERRPDPVERERTFAEPERRNESSLFKTINDVRQETTSVSARRENSDLVGSKDAKPLLTKTIENFKKEDVIKTGGGDKKSISKTFKTCCEKGCDGEGPCTYVDRTVASSAMHALRPANP